MSWSFLWILKAGLTATGISIFVFDCLLTGDTDYFSTRDILLILEVSEAKDMAGEWFYLV